MGRSSKTDLALRRAARGDCAPAAQRPEFAARLDLSPALRLAAGRRDRSRTHLTKRHPSVKHLYACEQSHCWRWVPDKQLSDFWRGLSPQERCFVVETHQDGLPAKGFSEEVHAEVREGECHASEGSKSHLASVILLDLGSMSLYKEIFTAAVQENVPLAINMEVIAAVDTVVQDFRIACSQKGDSIWTNPIVQLLYALLVPIAFWFGYWKSFVFLILFGIWRFVRLDAVDPRNFPEGSELWVEYREREHVRLMWISAMVRVFEMRLLHLWEARVAERKRQRRRLASPQAAALPLALPSPADGDDASDGGAADVSAAAAADAAKAKDECCEHPPLPADAEETTVSAESARSSDAALPDDVVVEADGAIADDAASDKSARGPAASAKIPKEGDPCEGLDKSQDDTCDDTLDDLELEPSPYEGEDELDAEFRRRVKEHLRSRASAARKGAQLQTARGNQILKALCLKLKDQLEAQVGHGE